MKKCRKYRIKFARSKRFILEKMEFKNLFFFSYLELTAEEHRARNHINSKHYHTFHVLQGHNFKMQYLINRCYTTNLPLPIRSWY